MRKTKVEGWRLGVKEERRWESDREGAKIWVIVVGRRWELENSDCWKI